MHRAGSVGAKVYCAFVYAAPPPLSRYPPFGQQLNDQGAAGNSSGTVVHCTREDKRSVGLAAESCGFQVPPTRPFCIRHHQVQKLQVSAGAAHKLDYLRMAIIAQCLPMISARIIRPVTCSSETCIFVRDDQKKTCSRDSIACSWQPLQAHILTREGAHAQSAWDGRNISSRQVYDWHLQSTSTVPAARIFLPAV